VDRSGKREEVIKVAVRVNVGRWSISRQKQAFKKSEEGEILNKTLRIPRFISRSNGLALGGGGGQGGRGGGGGWGGGGGAKEVSRIWRVTRKRQDGIRVGEASLSRGRASSMIGKDY